jgi:hypothetical protein
MSGLEIEKNISKNANVVHRPMRGLEMWPKDGASYPDYGEVYGQ